jgi:DNA replication initiation complex subunit (GINS family)
VGQIGSVYKQPETEEDDSCHSWRVPSKWKGVQRGVKEKQQGEQGEIEKGGKRNCAMYICNCNVYVKE